MIRSPVWYVDCCEGIVEACRGLWSGRQSSAMSIDLGLSLGCRSLAYIFCGPTAQLTARACCSSSASDTAHC